MKVLVLSIILSSAAAYPPITNYSCPVPELNYQCIAECQQDYISCVAQCWSYNCYRECVVQFSNCDNFCPCGTECPLGCVDCEHHLCEQVTSTTISTTTTKAPSLSPADTSIMVFQYEMSETYLLAGDGLSMTQASVSFPSEFYTMWAPSAVLKDVLHIFGGYYDSQKVARLEGCDFVELSARMRIAVDIGGAALAVEEQSKALICFDTTFGKYCDLFDGEEITWTFTTFVPHAYGSLGFYEGNPTTVGSRYVNGHQKVETLTSSGWISLHDHPKQINTHNLIGLKSGALLLIGGTEFNSEIWKLEKGSWSISGNMRKGVEYASSILIGDSIYVVAGKGNDGNPIQRIDLDDEQIMTVEIIGNHEEIKYSTVLFHASNNFCAQI